MKFPFVSTTSPKGFVVTDEFGVGKLVDPVVATRTIQDTASLSAYTGAARRVRTENGLTWTYYASYPLAANGIWILSAAIGSGVWVNEDARRVSLLKFGVKPGSVGLSSATYAANCTAIQSAINSGEFLSFDGYDITFDGTLAVSGVGSVGFSLMGRKGVSRLIGKSDASVLQFNTTADPNGGYVNRIQQIYLEGFTLIKDGGTLRSGAPGIDIRNFGMVELEDIWIENYGIGLNVLNGSEILCKMVRTPGNGIGMKFQRDQTNNIDGDMAAVELVSCHSHDNNVMGVEIDGVRQVILRGGSYGASQGTTAVLVHGSKAAVDYAVLDGINLENTASNSALIIGKTGSNYPVTQVNLTNVQLALPTQNKIILHSQAGIVNLRDCNIDGNHNPTIKILSTQTTNPIINITGCSPYWAEYNIYDDRVTTKPTALTVFKRPLINAYNTDFRKSFAGYVPSAFMSDDKVNFVTGDRSVKFAGTGTEKYLQVSFYGDAGQGLALTENQQISVEYIAKFSAAHAILGAVTTDTNDANISLTIVSQVFMLQAFSNGFNRYNTMYTVPPGRKLVNLRLMNNVNMNADLWIDSLKLFSNDLPRVTTVYGNATPTAGYWYAGERVRSTTVDLTQPSEYVCVTSGDPGTWKAVYPNTSSGSGLTLVADLTAAQALTVAGPTLIIVQTDSEFGDTNALYIKTPTTLERISKTLK